MKKGKAGMGMWIIAGLLLLAGCRIVTEEEKVRDLEFVVVGDDCLPEELKTIIEEKKAEVCKLTFIDGEELYIVVGYGRQKTGGYSIQVKECYLGANAIYVDTCLLGPKPGGENHEASSYPYIVLRTKELGVPVVFQ